jgi:DNA-binding CsgD family transcriptional regulator
MNAQSPLTTKRLARAVPAVHQGEPDAQPRALEWALRHVDPRQTSPRRGVLLHEPRAGTALEILLGLSAAQRARLVVVTDNPCPEYAMDLLALQPGALFFGVAPSTTELSCALASINSGTPQPSTAGFTSSLLPSERAILRFLPSGECDKRIARALGLSHRTVRNRLASILEKLHLENRTQVAMYYSGQWQWLPRYREALQRASNSLEA